MKHDWEYKKLGEVSCYPNKRISLSELNPQQFVGVETLVKDKGGVSFSETLPNADVAIEFIQNDILVGNIRPYLKKIWMSDRVGGASGDVINIRINDEYKDLLKPSFLYKVLSSDKFFDYDNANTHGAKMPRGDRNAIAEYTIPVPPLPTQQSIVSELDSLSKIIADCKETLKDYDALEQSVFYDMFGDPVKNDKGWEMKKLGDIATCTIGLTYKPEDVSPSSEGIIVLRSGNIQQSVLDFEDIVRVTSKVPEKKFVEDGDILMCTRNGSFRLVGKVAKIIGLQERMSYGAFMTIIRSQHNTYLFEYFRTSAFRESLIQGQTSTVNQITVKMLNELSLPIPPLPLQQQFASKIEAIEQMRLETKKALQEAETLFNARMDYWFN